MQIHQSLIRWYARQPGFKEKPDMVTVLLVGPTGKSAFHIGGTTIHSALGIPVTQNKNKLKPMSAELKNKFRNRLWNLKVIIIDEVSMVGAGTLQHIHKRLVEKYPPLAENLSDIPPGNFGHSHCLLDMSWLKKMML